MSQEQEHNKCCVTIDLPYPPVQTDTRRPEYAYAMMSNVGSENSEMSAISLYFYNSVILNPEYEHFAECFQKISIVEMHHMNTFATLAYQMGLDPRFWASKNNQSCYWSPSYNNYPRQIRELVENSLKGELAAVEKYTRQAETICDTNIVAILDRIILDEQHHIEIFHNMLEELD